ncbi:uncharacterized protein LOC143891598 [Tasmannia lanceolata]|uniref:uncharacterized protein LOC143866839 n=1 Tax=Tasmannia lanceolata TaxID=3420 RepID=UPI004064A180
MSIAHSTWPVVLIPYNLPPWMCMKQPYIMLSLLIPGLSSPGNDIDVYLQPLIEELKELWVSGLQTYDASRQETFQMHASLLWTISDFPAYANLSGWSTKGKLACPSCNKDTCSLRLKHGRKFCYMGHRRFLEANHRFRSDKSSFNGTKEKRENKGQCKSTIRFTRNGTEKDTSPSDYYKEQNILAPSMLHNVSKGERCSLQHPEGCQASDGYSSNISRRVNVRERKISGLKSHDCHVLMQQLLPLVIRSSLPKNVSSVLIELCNFFKELCSKVLNVGDLLKLQDRIALTLCHMEKIFPPAFFDIMVHLPIHLADEAMLAGPVQYRWMYPIERSEHISEKLRWLAGGPAPVARKYKGFISKGFRFHTKAREQKRKTQNCGVVVTANTRSFSSARDQNPVAGDISYYGVLTDIIELNYFGRLKALLFKCDWFDVVTPNRGIKIDAFGYTVTKPRDLYELHGNNDEGDVQTEAAEIQNLEDVNSWERIDIGGTEIDEPLEQLTQAIPDDEECDTDSDDSDGDESPFANDK